MTRFFSVLCNGAVTQALQSHRLRRVTSCRFLSAKFFSRTYLIFFGGQCFCLCKKLVFLEELGSYHGVEEWHLTETCKRSIELSTGRRQ